MLITRFDIDKKYIAIMKAIISTIGIVYVVGVPIISIYPLILCGICAYVYMHENIVRKDSLFIKVTAIIFALFLVGGKIEFIIEKGGLYLIFKLFSILIGNYFLLCWVVRKVFNFYDSIKIGHSKLSANIVFTISLIFIAIFWVPIWRYAYPGILTYDSIVQVQQIFGKIPFTNHHPAIHTLWIKLLYNIAVFLGIDGNTKIFGFISFVQLLIMDFIFSLTVRYIYKKSKKLSLALMSMAFYGIVSYNAYYSVTIWKDIAHGIISVLFLVILCYYFDTKNRKICVGLLVSILICGCLFCLLRGNAFYAVALWGVGIFLYFLKYRDKKILATFFLIIIISAIIKGPIYTQIGVLEGNPVENLSIPVQQVAYVITKGESLKEDEIELLSKIVDLNEVPVAYKDYIADPIKLLIADNIDYLIQNKLKYLGLYLKLGIRYPIDYFIAWVKQTYGYWYPDVSYWVYSTGVEWNEYNIVYTPILSEDAIKRINNNASMYLQLPLYGSLWNLGTFTWCLIIVTAYLVYKKKWSNVLINFLLLCIWGTLLIATPVFAEFRYFYSVVASLPLILTMPILVKGTNEEDLEAE